MSVPEISAADLRKRKEELELELKTDIPDDPEEYSRLLKEIEDLDGLLARRVMDEEGIDL